NKLAILAAVALLQLTGTSARINSTTVDPEDRCPTLCERDFMPQCGSDSVTYANICLLKVAHCLDPEVKRKHKGRCKK
ncbi:hypothetical protein PHYSODRAFT_440880, partial [Phytophthora sojae]